MKALELARLLIELVEVHGDMAVIKSFPDERPDCPDHKLLDTITQLEIEETQQFNQPAPPIKRIII